MVSILIRFVINAIALWVADALIADVSVSGSAVDWIILLVVFGLINALIKPVLKLLTLPINIATLGLFTLVINAFLFWLTSVLVPALDVNGIIPTFLGALVVTIVSTVLSWVLPD